MSTLGVYDAKARFSELIDRAEKGEEIIVTRHGRPVARVAPLASAGDRGSDEVRALMERWRSWRAAQRETGQGASMKDILAWRDEGRR